MSGLSILSRWLLLGEWRAHPVRAVLAVTAIAVGVAMGFAIHLINAAAFNEFSAAIKSLSGQADLQVRGIAVPGALTGVTVVTLLGWGLARPTSTASPREANS